MLSLEALPISPFPDELTLWQTHTDRRTDRETDRQTGGSPRGNLSLNIMARNFIKFIDGKALNSFRKLNLAFQRLSKFE